MKRRENNAYQDDPNKEFNEYIAYYSQSAQKTSQLQAQLRGGNSNLFKGKRGSHGEASLGARQATSVGKRRMVNSSVAIEKYRAKGTTSTQP